MQVFCHSEMEEWDMHKMRRGPPGEGGYYKL